MLVEEKPEDTDQFLLRIPHQLRKRFLKAIEGLYETETEAYRDLARKFADSRGVP